MYQSHRLLTHVTHDITSFNPFLEYSDYGAVDTSFQL